MGMTRHQSEGNLTLSLQDKSMSQPQRHEVLVFGSGAGGKLLAWHLAGSGRPRAEPPADAVRRACGDALPRRESVSPGRWLPCRPYNDGIRETAVRPNPGDPAPMLD